ncbi:MAG: PP2C family protein-serine/threonine phosphatase [Pseudomonadota bacterium]
MEKLSAITEISVFGQLPDGWDDHLSDITVLDAAPAKVCLVNFDDPFWRAKAANRPKTPPAEMAPVFIAITAKQGLQALGKDYDIIIPPDVTPDYFYAQIQALDRRLSNIRRVHSRLEAGNINLSGDAASTGLNNDLAQAKKLQQALLSDRFYSVEHGQISLMLQERHEIGGDMVGHFPVNNTTTGFFAFDVSGHGITSALLISRLAGMVSGSSPSTNIAMREQWGITIPKAPSKVIATMNQIMFDEMDTDQYFTAVLGFFDHSTGRVTFCQAGHPHPLHIDAAGVAKPIGSGGMPIGLIPGADYKDSILMLKSGDRFLAVSDGMTELHSGVDNQQLTEDGLAQLIQPFSSMESGEFFQHIKHGLKEFLGDGDFDDDLSAVLIDYRPKDMNLHIASLSPDDANTIKAAS